MVDVPAFNVKFVAFKQLQRPQDIADEPRFNVRADAPVEVKLLVTVRLKFAVENVPAENVKLLLVVNALPNVHPPPTPVKLTGFTVTPLVVIVHPVVVAANCMVLPAVQVTPVAAIVRLPQTLKTPLLATVTLPEAGPEIDRLRQDTATALLEIVTVYAVRFDSVSKNTSSLRVGTDAPLAPPDKADQLVVEVVSQPPVPPTQ
jgi:hypothetical protein